MSSATLTALRSSIGGHAVHGRHDSRELGRRGQAGLLRRFEEEADPTGELDPAERRRRAEHLRRSHMQQLRYRALKLRQQPDASVDDLLALSRDLQAAAAEIAGDA